MPSDMAFRHMVLGTVCNGDRDFWKLRCNPLRGNNLKKEKHILDDEKEARSYFDQLWAEVMEIYWSTENKSSLLKFSKEMEQEISEYRKQFTQEDTMAGMIQGWLDAYKGRNRGDIHD